ncbi:MAG: sodium:solute symporter family protein [Pygmaiobacter sp.]
MTITVTWIIVFVFIVGVGMYAGKAISSSKEWSGGDKTMNAWNIGCVLGAWQIGGMSIVGAAQNGYTIGIAGAWYSIAGAIYFIVAALLAQVLREGMPGDSVPAYLQQRFSSSSARLYSYVWVILGFFYIPVQLKTVASVIQIAVPNLNTNLAIVAGLCIATLYTAFSGMKGAASVGKIVCIGIYVLLVGFVVLKLPSFGGYSGLVSTLPEGFEKMSSMPTQKWVGWIISGVLSSIVMQSVLQPIMAAKSVKSARAGCLIGYAFSAPICIFTAMIGMMGRGTTDTLGDGATAFAWTIREYSSPIMAGIIFAVATMIIAATMATMMMATGTIITNIYKTQINKNASEEKILKISRYGTVIFSFCTLIPAFLLPSAALTSTFQILIQCSTGPVSFSILAGLLWKRATKQASFYSMLSGVIVGLLWVVSGMSAKLETVYIVILVSYTVGIITTLLTSKKQNSDPKAEAATV